MQKFNKDGTRTLEWLREREEDLMKMNSVKWYLKFNKQPESFKKNLIKKYDTYTNEVRESDAYKLYQQIREAMESNNLPEVKRLASIAREKLINEDYKSAPAQYDPTYIESDFFVSQYLWVISEIKKQTDGFNLSDMHEALI